MTSEMMDSDGWNKCNFEIGNNHEISTLVSSMIVNGYCISVLGPHFSTSVLGFGLVRIWLVSTTGVQYHISQGFSSPEKSSNYGTIEAGLTLSNAKYSPYAVPGFLARNMCTPINRSDLCSRALLTVELL